MYFGGTWLVGSCEVTVADVNTRRLCRFSLWSTLMSLVRGTPVLVNVLLPLLINRR